MALLNFVLPVPAFASTNLGDVSPNTNGTYCMDTGLPCEPVHSTCNGKNEMCVGRGPGTDMFESAKIIGERQYVKANEIYESANKIVSGPVDFRHTFIDMSNLTFTRNNSTGPDDVVHTCPGAMGYAFAAGTVLLKINSSIVKFPANATSVFTNFKALAVVAVNVPSAESFGFFINITCLKS